MMPTRRRVLVVDDCQDTAESLALLVRLWGHEARTAYRGQAALEAFRRHRPHVTLLDLGLPGMTGFDVAREVRKLEGAGPLLVAITGFGREQDVQRCWEAGFNLHLLKPVDPDTLERLLTAEAGTTAQADRSTALPGSPRLLSDVQRSSSEGHASAWTSVN
jgi:CheY-like chemotaxis protein